MDQGSRIEERPDRNDPEAFQRLAEPFRRELKLHCYRMLGSLSDAEDLVQETFVRAWRGLDEFEGRGQFRGWLYRIATNACLNALASRASARRVLPESQGPPSDRMPALEPASEIAWLEPYPDLGLEGIADTAQGPDARYELRETVQLAFVAVIQHLPPRQRAASVNSALQRARATLAKRFPSGRPEFQPAPDDRQRGLLDRYMRAWEGSDLDTFVALLREDAVYSMPPWRDWYRGREAIRAFFGWAWRSYGGFRLIPTSANLQPAFAVYSRAKTGSEWRAHSIQLLALQDDSVAALTVFKDPKLFDPFVLPAVL